MAAGLLIFPGAFPSRDRQGDRISAQIGFYQNGAPGTPKTVYADVGLTTPLANPVPSDVLGNFPAIYADEAQAFTAIWTTNELQPQTRTLDDLTPSTSANQTILDQTLALRDQTEDLRDDTAQLKADTAQIKDDTQDILDQGVALYGNLAAVQQAVTDSQTAAGQSQTFRNQAEGFKNDASGYATAASGSAGNALAQANAAAASANTAKSYTGGVGFNFSTTTTDADPGNGNLRLNNATPASATFIYADLLSADGEAITSWLDALDDSNSASKGQIYLRDAATGAFAIYAIIGAVVTATGYRKIPVNYLGGSGTAFTNANRIGFAFAPAGDTPAANGVGYVAKSAAYTVVAADIGKIIDCTGTFTLGFSAPNVLGNGFYCYPRNSGTGVITISSIDGSTITLAPGDVWMIESDASALHGLALKREGYVLLGPLPAAGGGTTSDFALPQGYSEIRVEIGGVNYGGSGSFWFDFSDDGVTFSNNAIILGGANTNGKMYASVNIMRPNSANPNVLVTAADPGALSSNNTATNTGIPYWMLRCDSGRLHTIRFRGSPGPLAYSGNVYGKR